MPSFELKGGSDRELQKSIDNFKKKYNLTVNVSISGYSGSGDPLAQLEESDVPSCIGFLNMAIDVKTLDIILTPTALIAPVRLSNLGTMFSHILDKPLNNDELLRLIEVYKLNGKFDQFMKDLVSSEVVAGSVISSYLASTTTILPKEARQKILTAVGDLRADKNQFSGNLTSWRNFSPAAKVYSRAMMKSFQTYVNPTDSDQTLYKSSLIDNEFEDKVTEIKCSNILEMTKLAMDEDDVIYSSDTKKALTRMGFDKLITARELTSIANAVNSSAKLRISSSWRSEAASLPSTVSVKSGDDKNPVLTDVVKIGFKNMFELLYKVAKAYGRGD